MCRYSKCTVTGNYVLLNCFILEYWIENVFIYFAEVHDKTFYSVLDRLVLRGFIQIWVIKYYFLLSERH